MSKKTGKLHESKVRSKLRRAPNIPYLQSGTLMEGELMPGMAQFCVLCAPAPFGLQSETGAIYRL